MARNDQEHVDQRALVAWARHASATGVATVPAGYARGGRVALDDRQRDALALLYAVPNGARTGRRQAGRLKAEGMLAGVPDLFLPFPRAGKPGLYVEMKTATGTLSRDQRAVTAALARLGYGVVVAKGFEAARRAVLDHLLGR